MFIFKIIGAFVGYSYSPPVGGLLGLILGHSIDEGLAARQENRQAEQQQKNRETIYRNQMFMRGLFGMIARIVNASGNYSPKEKQAVERFIKENLRLKRKAQKEVTRILAQERVSNRSFNSYALEFYEASSNDHSVLKPVLFTLLGIALADGQMTPEEQRLINIAAQIFGIELEQSQRSNPNQPSAASDPYKILGCNRNDPLPVIRKRFRQLALELHPDKLAAKQLPDDFLKYANHRFAMLKEAYDQITKKSANDNCHVYKK